MGIKADIDYHTTGFDNTKVKHSKPHTKSQAQLDLFFGKKFRATHMNPGTLERLLAPSRCRSDCLLLRD